MFFKLLALTLALCLGIALAVVGTSGAEGTGTITDSTTEEGSTTVVTEETTTSSTTTGPVIAPKIWRICGQAHSLAEWPKSVLVGCARGYKKRVNANLHIAHLKSLRPDPWFWQTPKLSLIKWKIPNWRDVKLPASRVKKAEHRSWHRSHTYSIATHYGVPWNVISNFTCIHRWEGSWTDPNYPYYGGLQMDMNFMQAYGHYKGMNFLSRWGTANYWPIWAQFRAGYNALLAGRGYYPWPLTARRCGLI